MTTRLSDAWGWLRRLAIAVAFVAGLPAGTSFAISAPPDEATKEAINLTLDAAQAAGLDIPGDKDTRDTVTNALACAIGGEKLLNCARDALVDKLPDEAKPFADCLLKGGDAPTCASKGFVGLVEKQISDPTLRKAAQCVTDDLGKGDQAGAAQCLIDPAAKEAVKALPPDLAKCFDTPDAAKQCTLDKLGPLSGTAQCIATSKTLTDCTSAQAGNLSDALDTFKKLVPDGPSLDPSKPGQSLTNLMKVATAIRDGHWDQVGLYGGAELYKAASHIVIQKILPELVPGLGHILAYLSGPIIDTLVQDRVDLVQELWDQLKSCDPGRGGGAGTCDVPKMGEILVKFAMIMQIEIPCALLKESIVPDGVAEAICGPAVKFIDDVASAGLDIYEDNTKAIAAAAAVYVNPAVGAIVLATDPDVQKEVGHLVTGQQGDCPSNYFANHMNACVARSAELSLVDPSAAAAFRNHVNADCRSAFNDCSQRHTGGESDRISGHCNPLMSAFDQMTEKFRDGVAGLANNYADLAFNESVDVCSPDYAIDEAADRFASKCAADLHSQVPALQSSAFTSCAEYPGPGDIALAACRAAGRAKLLAQRNDFFQKTLGISAAAGSPAIKTYCDHRASCDGYAYQATRDAKENIDLQCGGDGPRWTTDYGQHKDYCLRVTDAETQSEEQARQSLLTQCRSCQDYADRATKLARVNVELKCGGVGPRWSLNTADHATFCRSSSQAAMTAEDAARRQFLDACRTSQLPPGALCVKRPFNLNCAPNTGQFSGGAVCACPAHYHGVDTSNLGFFDKCTPDDDVTLPCAPANQPGSPPQCFGGKILNSGGGIVPPGVCACPPGATFNGTTCSGGSNATLACDAPFVGTKPNCACPPGQQPQGNTCIPIPVQCDPPLVGVKPNCACPPGQQPQGNTCIPIPVQCDPPFIGIKPNCACPPGQQPQGNTCVPIPVRCDAPFIGIKPNCACPPGQQPQGNTCVQIPVRCDAPFIGIKPNCACPPGQQPQGNTCVPIPVRCDAPFIGIKPNCACPPGQQPQGNTCVPIPVRCDAPFIGIKPNCACPPGQQPQGNTCAPIPVRCDAPFIGIKPNCACPPGQQPQGNTCVPIPVRCDAPFIGIKPNCACPPGQQPQGNTCVPIPVRCDAPFIGIKPNCACPPGQQQRGNTCIPIPVRCDPPFVGIKPNCACPPGQQQRGNTCIPIPVRCDPPFVGTKPNCTCPPGQQQQGNTCILIPVRCDPPFLGTKPNCKCPLGSLGTPPTCCAPGQLFQNGQCVKPATTHVCPPGYKVLTTPNKFGAFCEEVAPAKQCDTSKGEILYPDGNCACPPGTGRYGANGACAKPGTVACDPPFIGRKPDCSCPPGQQQQGFKCVPAQPIPTGPAPHPTCGAGQQLDPATKNCKPCPLIDVCDKSKGVPGTLGSVCVKSHKEPACGAGPVVR